MGGGEQRLVRLRADHRQLLNRIEGQFSSRRSRYFMLDGTDQRSHEEQNRMIRRYIAWLNRFEWSPGCRNQLYLNNRAACDAAVLLKVGD